MRIPDIPPARLYVGMSRRTVRRDPASAREKDIGRPHLAQEALATGASVLISSNALWSPSGGFVEGVRDATFQLASLGYSFALDSAGFTAMKQYKGYRWTVPEYVEMAMHAGAWISGGEWRGPTWDWWAQMDYCVEKEIARSQLEVTRRVHLTAEALGDSLACVDGWLHEVRDVTYAEADDWERAMYPDPMPVLQGWTAQDYLTSIRLADDVFKRAGREWPDVVGIGSVCRRHASGPAGLLTVVPAVAQALPPHVRLHLFGIKGGAVPKLAALAPGRIASVDSFAWDLGVRRYVQKQIKSIPCPDCAAVVDVGCVREDSFFGAGRKAGFCPARVQAAAEAGLDVSSTLEVKSRHLDPWIKTQLEALNHPGVRLPPGGRGRQAIRPEKRGILPWTSAPPSSALASAITDAAPGIRARLRALKQPFSSCHLSAVLWTVALRDRGFQGRLMIDGAFDDERHPVGHDWVEVEDAGRKLILDGAFRQFRRLPVPKAYWPDRSIPFAEVTPEIIKSLGCGVLLGQSSRLRR